jgi:hypothetical protein
MGELAVKKKENRGGKREGAGGKPKPPREFSEDFKGRLIAAERKLIERYGKDVHEVMLERMYSDQTQDAVAASVYKTYCDVLSIKHSVKEVVDRRQAPVVGLPPIRDDETEYPPKQ